MKKIYITGSVNTDFVIAAPYMPVGGETLTGSDFFVAKGGKGANQAIAASRLGGYVAMCACVGNDIFGQDALESFRKEGINVDHIRTVKGVSTGTAVIIVTGGENRIILDRGANGLLTREDIDSFLENAAEGDIYLTQMENPIEIVGYGLKKAREKGLYVVLNPAPADEKIKPYLKYCDLITPNETELELLGGKQEILSKSSATLIVTQGSKGYTIYDQNSEKAYPCMKIEAVDTTAAGDTLCGGLCAKLAQGDSLENAVAFGSRAATIACTKKGAQLSIPTTEEVHYVED